jgi:hypothetical protein
MDYQGELEAQAFAKPSRLRHCDTLPTALQLLRRIGMCSRVDQGKAHNALASLSQNFKRDVATHREPYQREPARADFKM